MRMIDKMKDEKLGSAILYNFTVGYGEPVPMDVYNLVLPFMFHDAFRANILACPSFQATIEKCFREDYRGLAEFKDG